MSQEPRVGEGAINIPPRSATAVEIPTTTRVLELAVACTSLHDHPRVQSTRPGRESPDARKEHNPGEDQAREDLIRREARGRMTRAGASNGRGDESGRLRPARRFFPVDLRGRPNPDAGGRTRRQLSVLYFLIDEVAAREFRVASEVSD
jgi:hypothetical protein